MERPRRSPSGRGRPGGRDRDAGGRSRDARAVRAAEPGAGGPVQHRALRGGDRGCLHGRGHPGGQLMPVETRTAADVRVALLPTLPFHAGMSMQVYASEVTDSLAGIAGIRAEILRPPFASHRGVGWARSRWARYVAYPGWAA